MSDSDGMDDFLGLIKKFAKMDITLAEKGETCPICQATELLLDEFPKHLLVCIKKLENEDDEKFAMDLCGDSVIQSELLSHYSPLTICDQGAYCNRRDRQHFQNLYHPPINCPICAVEFSMADIESHLVKCMEDQSNTEKKESEEYKTTPLTSVAFSKNQLIAISNTIVETSESDISDILNSFAKLGFNRETLKNSL